jgi:hypothetical protein
MFVLVWGLLGACGDHGFSIGIPADKGLGTLDSTQAAQMCTAADSYLDGKAQRASCKFGAVGTAVTRGISNDDARRICRIYLDACLTMPAADVIDTLNCKAPDASCTATVGEYEACLNDVASEYDRRIASLSGCDGLILSRSALPAITLLPPQLPSSCSALTSECPTIHIPITVSPRR